ncbi:MAG: hypothetical protein U1C96_07005 [Gallionella sp.]|nr:hypothetical protein [Gallionella sp.]
MTKQEKAEMYRSYLAEEGFTPKLDDDGDISFKFEGKNYLIIIDEGDSEFFRLVYPWFWPIESEDEREKAAQAALYASTQTKVAKVYPVRDDTWAAVEIFCSPPEAFQAVFKRSLGALQAAVHNFRERMQQSTSH